MVLIAVATLESAFFIPHFASIDVRPAKNADPKAYNTHIYFLSIPSLNIYPKMHLTIQRIA